MEKSEKLKQLLDYIGINEDNVAYFTTVMWKKYL